MIWIVGITLGLAILSELTRAIIITMCLKNVI